jgi:hypothetical protein
MGSGLGCHAIARPRGPGPPELAALVSTRRSDGAASPGVPTARAHGVGVPTAWSENGVRLAQKTHVGPRIPVGIQRQKAKVGPTCGQTRHLSHLAPQPVPGPVLPHAPRGVQRPARLRARPGGEGRPALRLRQCLRLRPRQLAMGRRVIPTPLSTSHMENHE